MIESFEFYEKRNKVVKQNVSEETVNSLLKKAKKRLVYIKSQKLNEKNSDFIFEDIYESIRESAQALLAKAGYKPYSHEALVAFVKERYSEFTPDEIYKFDEYRQIRNRLVYYAEHTTLEKTKEALGVLKKFIPKVNKLLKK